MTKLAILTTIFVILLPELVFSQETNTEKFVNRIEMSLYYDTLEEVLAKMENIDSAHKDKEKVLRKAILLFRKGILTYETENCTIAYNFINEMYDTIPEYQIPVILAYKGAIRAAIAGSLTDPNPMLKLKLLGEGEEMLNIALEQQMQKDGKDYLAMGYIHFLRGRTFSLVPTFLAPSKKTTRELKKALSYYKKVKTIHPTLVANIFYSYGLYYLNVGKITLALKNMDKSTKYADPDLLKEIEDKINIIRDE